MKNSNELPEIALIGTSGSGKSSIAASLVGNNIREKHQITIAAGFFKTKENIRIWDTAGSKRFHSMIPIYLNNNIVLFVINGAVPIYENKEILAKFLKSVPIRHKIHSLYVVVSNGDRLSGSELGYQKLAHNTFLNFTYLGICSALENSNIKETFAKIKQIELSKQTVDEHFSFGDHINKVCLEKSYLTGEPLLKKFPETTILTQDQKETYPLSKQFLTLFAITSTSGSETDRQELARGFGGSLRQFVALNTPGSRRSFP